MEQKKTRNLNVEALRCFLMLLIVYVHAYAKGLWGENGGWWGNSSLAFFKWNLISFVAISGWFGVKFSIRKFFFLWWQLVFYAVLSACLMIVFDGKVGNWNEILSIGGWFAASYMMLLFCAPFVNKCIEKLAADDVRLLWKLWGLVMIGYVLNWMPYHALTRCCFAVASSLSFFTILFVYVTMRIIAASGIGSRLGSARVLGLSFGGLLGYVVVSGLLFKFLNPAANRIMCYYISYENPFVWIVGLVVVCFTIYHVKIPNGLGRLVAFVSPSMFGVFLFHEGTSFGRKLYVPCQQWLSSNSSLHPFFIVLFSAVVAFAICLAVDMLRRALFCVVSKMWLSVKS